MTEREIRERREARGMADPLNRLRARTEARIASGDAAPILEDDGEGGITPEGLALGHRYVMGNVNAFCPKCSREQGVAVLDCDYDLDK